MAVDDLDAALAATEPEPVTSVSVASPRRHRHVYHTWFHMEGFQAEFHRKCVCGAIKDEAKSRRGTSARRLGHDQERRQERTYGPRKVGEYGDAIDLIGRDFMWQSKATRQPPPQWLAVVTAPISTFTDTQVAAYAVAMQPLLRGKSPLIIRSYIHPGIRTRDWIWVPASAWKALHGNWGFWETEWIVMSGEWFLSEHGRDEP